MPGVVISTSVRTGPSTATVRESSQLFIVGLAERGPSSEAVLVESIADFENIFGGYKSDSYLHPLVECFFEEGGTRAYVTRTVGASALVGGLNLNDGSDPVITITANGAGDWSEDVEIEVTNPTVSSFKINLYYQSTLVYTTGTVTSAAQAVGRINLSSIASRYINAVVVDESLIPDAISATQLSAGDADESSVNDAAFASSLAVFNDALGTGAVACADSSTSTMAASLVEHANAYNRIALLYTTETATAANAITFANAITTADNSEHAAMYFPWVEVPTTVPGVTRFIPPVGYVAGKRAVAHNQTGPHLPAAGLVSSSRFVVGLRSDVNNVVGNELDENSVNALRIIQNTVRIYGARSCSSDTDNFRYITQQDVVNSIVSECYRSLEDLVFSPIDGRNTIFANIEARLVVILASMRDLGALYPAFDVNGRQIDNGYTVKCDSSINPASQLQTGLVKARVGVRVSSVGDSIEIDIVKSNLTASVV